MNNITENTDLDDRSQLKYIILLNVYGFFTLIITAGTMGLIIGHFSRDDISMTWKFSLLLLAALSAALLFGYATYRTYKAGQKDTEALTPKEKLNRNILIGCMVIGGIIGATLVLVSDDPGNNPLALFSNSPVSPILAIILAIFMLIIMPIVTYYWHTRASDEQELHSIRVASYYALSVYMLGAPAWWILWRGGLVPEPNGIAIYYITLSTMGVFWLQKKYQG